MLAEDFIGALMLELSATIPNTLIAGYLSSTTLVISERIRVHHRFIRESVWYYDVVHQDIPGDKILYIWNVC